MRSILLALSTALLLAAPADAAVTDFRLPAPSETQQPPDRQGPVAPDVPASRGPAPPRPANTPAPAPAATPIVIPPPIVTSPSPSPTALPGQRSVAPEPAIAPSAEAPTGDATGREPTVRPDEPSPIVPVRPVGTDEVDQGGGGSWPWFAGGALIFAGLIGAGVVWRRKQRGVASRTPQVERPRVSPPLPQPVPASPQAAPAEALQVALEPLRMSLTLMNAALAYRLQITNHGPAPLTGLSIGADMIAAHASMTREEHLAGPAKGAAAQSIDRLEPGESRIIEGEFRVPFSRIIPIRNGNAALLLPLARFRVEAKGTRPVIRTFAVGQPGNGALQPFRLDQGPRIYPDLAQRTFA